MSLTVKETLAQEQQTCTKLSITSQQIVQCPPLFFMFSFFQNQFQYFLFYCFFLMNRTTNSEFVVYFGIVVFAIIEFFIFNFKDHLKIRFIYSYDNIQFFALFKNDRSCQCFTMLHSNGCNFTIQKGSFLDHKILQFYIMHLIFCRHV